MKGNIISKLDKYKINSKGDLSIQFLAEMTTVMILVIFIVEFSALGFRHAMAVNTVNKVAKTISVQSGLENSIPLGYTEFNSYYVTLPQFKSKLDNIMINIVKVSKYDATLIHKKADGTVIKNVNLKTEGSDIKMDYGDFFDLELTYEIELKFIKSVIPTMGNARGKVLISGIAEYKDYRDYVDY